MGPESINLKAKAFPPKPQYNIAVGAGELGNLGHLYLRYRCFCNQNMGRSTTGPRRFRRLDGPLQPGSSFLFSFPWGLGV
jgi:hypothetical protein